MSTPLPRHNRIDELRFFKSGALSDANLHLVRHRGEPVLAFGHHMSRVDRAREEPRRPTRA